MRYKKIKIYTVTREEKDDPQDALKICWPYSFPTLELAEAEVVRDAIRLRSAAGRARGASFEWRTGETFFPSSVLEDCGRTWTIFEIELRTKP